MDPNIIAEVGILMTMGNLNNVMRNKQRELQPKRKRFGKFGTHTVSAKRTVGVYEL